MKQPLVSAVILNFRSPQPTVRCVQEMLKQSFMEEMEIIVVDNHSEDDSIGVLRNRLSQYPQVRIVETPANDGFGKGYACGVHHARGKYLLINNPDKILQQDGVERMVKAMESDDGIGILGPKLMHDDGSLRFSARSFPKPLDLMAKRTSLGSLLPTRLARYLQLGEDPEKQRDTDWVVGGCFLTPSQFFTESLHGFDTRFFLFFEDTDLCRRCWKAGKRVVYFPSVYARDKKRRLSEGSVLSLLTTRVGRAHLASGVKYFLKWGTKTS